MMLVVFRILISLIVTGLTIYYYSLFIVLGMVVVISLFYYATVLDNRHSDTKKYEYEAYTHIVMFFILVLTIIYVEEFAERKTNVTMYRIYDVYKYTDGGKKIHVDYLYEDKYIVFDYDKYNFNPYYMLLNNCQPILRYTETKYWINNIDYDATMECGKDMIREINETTAPIYLNEFNSSYEKYINRGL